jgi:hypothetical protein
MSNINIKIYVTLLSQFDKSSKTQADINHVLQNLPKPENQTEIETLKAAYLNGITSDMLTDIEIDEIYCYSYAMLGKPDKCNIPLEAFKRLIRNNSMHNILKVKGGKGGKSISKKRRSKKSKKAKRRTKRYRM